MKRHSFILIPLCLGLVGVLAPMPALAQDDTDDTDGTDSTGTTDDTDSTDDGDDDALDNAIDDILNETPAEETVGEEQDAVRAEPTTQVILPDEDAAKRIIKTIQKKNFLKLGRFEGGPGVAFVTNDPFLNRYIFAADLGYHITEVFALEANVGFALPLGDGDMKALTKQLVNENHVSPDLSPLTYYGNMSFAFSPIYGKAAISGQKVINFDIFGMFGMGFVRTADDLEALQQTDEPMAQATEFQIHPTTNLGGGIRVILNDFIAVRLEGRSLVYIETVTSTTLEMKNNFILQGGVSFFFPGMD